MELQDWLPQILTTILILASVLGLSRSDRKIILSRLDNQDKKLEKISDDITAIKIVQTTHGEKIAANGEK